MNLQVKPYQNASREQWDELVRQSANGTFLHLRSFMEYHGDRFEDASVMVWEGQHVLAVFPAHQVGNQVFSHQGLSFGGWIFKKGLEKNFQKEIIHLTLHHYKNRGVEKLTVTPVPTCYHREAVFDYDLLLELGFKIENVKDTAVILLPQEIKDRGKRWGVKKAKSSGISIAEKALNSNFWNNLLLPYHLEKLGRPPVHTWEEIEQLYKKHPDQISLFQASKGEEILAGLILFKYSKVFKIQYTALTENGKKYRAMDFLIQTLISSTKVDFIDFGTSVDPYTGEEKISLLNWKKSFGARSFPLKTFEFNLDLP